MSEVLKPCPMCQAKPTVNSRGGTGGVRCWKPDHLVQVYGATEAEAIAAWNQRVADHPVTSNPVADSEVGVGDCQAVQVTQADREAAADWLEQEGLSNTIHATNIRLGHLDDNTLVKAFARHRTASAPVATEAMVERVARAIARHYDDENIWEQFKGDALAALAAMGGADAGA